MKFPQKIYKMFIIFDLCNSKITIRAVNKIVIKKGNPANSKSACKHNTATASIELINLRKRNICRIKELYKSITMGHRQG